MTLSEALRAKAKEAEESARSLGIEIMRLEGGGCAVSGSAQALHAHRRSIAFTAAADAIAACLSALRECPVLTDGSGEAFGLQPAPDGTMRLVEPDDAARALAGKGTANG